VSYGDYVDPSLAAGRHRYLPDDRYAEALDALVIACVDVALLRNGSILMAHRAWHPHRDWWILGGRMHVGDEVAEAAHRNTKREAGLDIDPSRFSYLTTYVNGFPLRRQAPVANGSHTMSIVMRVELTEHEAESVRLNEEYIGMHWANPREIFRNAEHHPAMRQVAAAVQAI
jgi:ADP-ribose pyrophosphatase YjhB (NUDIX family)